MTLLFRLNAVIIIVSYSFLFGLVLICGGKASPLMALALISIPLSLIHPNLFFIFFMVSRPIADMASKTSILGINPASWLSVLFIIFCVKDFLVEDKSRLSESQPLLKNFNKYFGVLLFFSCLSFLYTADVRISVMDLIRLVSIGIAVNYVLTGFYRKEKDIELFCRMTLLSSVIPLSLGLYQWAFDAGRQIEGYNRIYGTFTHPNVFAEYLLFIFFICFYMIRNYQMNSFQKAAHLLLISWVTFELYQTYTRTIWIAFAICIFIYAMLQRKAVVKGVFLLLVSCFLLIALPLAKSRFSDITSSSHDRTNSLEWRLNLWRQTIGGIKEHPFFGSGLGMYEHKIGVMAHNDILRMAYETGLIVTAMYLFGFLLLAILGVREMRKAEAGLAREARLQISICLIVGFLISSLADNMIRSTVVMLYYFTTLMLFLSDRKVEAPA